MTQLVGKSTQIARRPAMTGTGELQLRDRIAGNAVGAALQNQKLRLELRHVRQESWPLLGELDITRSGR